MRSEVQVLLDPPSFTAQRGTRATGDFPQESLPRGTRISWGAGRGLSSAGRASALQAEGHRFDPDRLHQRALLYINRRLRLYRSAVLGHLFRPIGRIHIVKRDTHQLSCWFRQCAGIWGSTPRHVTIQVKYTNHSRSWIGHVLRCEPARRAG